MIYLYIYNKLMPRGRCMIPWTGTAAGTSTRSDSPRNTAVYIITTRRSCGRAAQ